MIKIQKISRKPMPIHDAWRVSEGEKLPVAFASYVADGRLCELHEGKQTKFIVLNFAQAAEVREGNTKAELFATPRLTASEGDYLAAACAPHNRLFVVSAADFEKKYRVV